MPGLHVLNESVGVERLEVARLLASLNRGFQCLYLVLVLFEQTQAGPYDLARIAEAPDLYLLLDEPYEVVAESDRRIFVM